METSALVALAGMGVVAMLVMFVVGVLMATLVLCVAFRLVLGYMPSYWQAWGVVLLTATAVAVAMVVLGIVMPGGASGLLAVAVAYLVGTALVNRLLLSRYGRPLGYGKAALVQLAYLAIALVLGLFVKAALAVVSGNALLGMH
jgi:hypothetical protein